MQSKDSHSKSLDYLVSHLNVIGENRKKTKWIMKEGIWLKHNSLNQKPFCDIICVYEEYGVPIELKGSFSHSKQARYQLRQGKEFIHDELGLDCPYGKIVIYPSFEFRQVNP